MPECPWCLTAAPWFSMAALQGSPLLLSRLFLGFLNTAVHFPGCTCSSVSVCEEKESPPAREHGWQFSQTSLLSASGSLVLPLCPLPLICGKGASCLSYRMLESSVGQMRGVGLVEKLPGLWERSFYGQTSFQIWNLWHCGSFLSAGARAGVLAAICGHS